MLMTRWNKTKLRIWRDVLLLLFVFENLNGHLGLGLNLEMVIFISLGLSEYRCTET